MSKNKRGVRSKRKVVRKYTKKPGRPGRRKYIDFETVTTGEVWGWLFGSGSKNAKGKKQKRR